VRPREQGRADQAARAQRDLKTILLDALVATGKDIDGLTPSDLAPVDEFHAGRGETAQAQAGVEPDPG